MAQENRETVATQLKNAFDAFNEIGTRLSDSYRALEEKVAQLTRELAQARSEKLQQLAEKERLAVRLHDLMEALPGGVLVLDRDQVVRQANQGAREWLGGELEGRSWSEIARSAFDAHDEALQLRDGRCLALSGSRLGDGGERVVLLSDITEIRRLQEQVSRKERLAELGEMSARLAHQIRTPLASVLLYLSQLDSPSLEERHRRRFVARARERLRHLEQTVNNMLAYARGVPSGKGKVSVGWLAEQFAQVMAPELSACGGVLEVEDETGPMTLEADGDAVLGALLNLGANAVQACEKGPRLRLRARRTENLLQIVLEDDGPGIDASLRDRVLEPFFTTRPNGTGLGLAVAKAVAQAHGGRLTIDDSTLGGAAVALELPLAVEEALPSGSRMTERREAVSPLSAGEKG